MQLFNTCRWCAWYRRIRRFDQRAIFDPSCPHTQSRDEADPLADALLQANAIRQTKPRDAMHIALADTRDVDRAYTCLAATESATGQVVDEAAMWSEAEFADKHQESEPAAVDDDDAATELTMREQNADRAWRGSILGLVFLPLQFYVSYLLWKVYLSDDELRREHRRHACLAAAINLLLMVGGMIIVRELLSF